jgi:ABC-type sugar transport system permease subunit
VTAAPLAGTAPRAAHRNQWKLAVVFLALPMLLFGTFYVVPLLYSMYISLFNYGVFGRDEFVGGGNYAWLLRDPYLHVAVRNTLFYTAVVVPGTMAVGLGLALLANAKLRGQRFFRSAFYFPSITSTAALTMIFMLLMAPGSSGIVNQGLGALGLPQPNWLGDSSTALPSIMVLNIWTGAGGTMLFYLAALQSVPTDIYEAAHVEGASKWHAFRTLTLPLLKRAHVFVAVMGTIGALKVFDQAFIVSAGTGGPNYSTLTLSLYIYRLAFANLSFGYAAAVGIALFVVIGGLLLTQRKMLLEQHGSGA